VFADEIYIVIGLLAGLGTWFWSYMQSRSAAAGTPDARQEV
jgi:hypothetical protein